MTTEELQKLESELAAKLLPLSLRDRLEIISMLAHRFAPPVAFFRGLPPVPPAGESDPVAHLRKEQP